MNDTDGKKCSMQNDTKFNNLSSIEGNMATYLVPLSRVVRSNFLIDLKILKIG